MERCGFGAIPLAGPASEVVAQVSLLSPEVLVFDLASGGARGLGVVEDLRRMVPGCAVVLLAPFDGLLESALEAGAYDLVGKDDLRDLERCLRRLRAELDARDASDLGTQPDLFVTPRSQRENQEERATTPAAAAVGEVAPGGPSQSPGDGEPEPRSSFSIQADEPVEDSVDGLFGNP